MAITTALYVLLMACRISTLPASRVRSFIFPLARLAGKCIRLKDLVISERAESEWNGETEVVFACRPLAVPEKMLFAEHHFSHAASTFYPSPFEEAAANLASSRRSTSFWNSFSPIHIGIALLKDLNPRDANAR